MGIRQVCKEFPQGIVYWLFLVAVNENIAQKILLPITALVAFVIGMKSLVEPDMWWYLRTGEWILENGKAPDSDVFSYTFSGVEWINVKWLYEVVVYFFERIGGPEFTSVFQSIVGVFLVLIISSIIRIQSGHKKNWIWPVIVIASLLVCSFRMTARPETISHLFSLVTILIFLNYKKGGEKWIWFWIPLQILWTNLHEAYATGLVLMGVFVAGEILVWKKEGKNWKSFTPGIAFIASIMAVSINPRGIQMILHPLEIFRQLGDNKFTTELFSWTSSYYWDQWQSYAFVLYLLIVLIALFFTRKSKGLKAFKEHVDSWSSGYFVILGLLAYLGFSAHRNIPFFVLASTPFVAVWLFDFLIQQSESRHLKLRFVPVAFDVLIYVLVISNLFYEFTGSKYRYGLRVDPGYNPIGLAEELKKIDYQQPHFSDYISSAYPLWAIKDFQSFIDLRDLDIFPEEFFNEVLMVSQNYAAFDQLAELNEFKYAFLKRTDYIGLIGHLNQDSSWRMIYADPVVVLFTKELDTQHTDIFEDYKTANTGDLSSALNLVFNPLYSEEKLDIDPDYMAATFFNGIGEFELAYLRLNKEFEDELRYETACLRGLVLNSMALELESDSLKSVSWKMLGDAKKLDRSNGKAFFNLGLSFYRNGMVEEAVAEFRQCVKRDSENADAWSLMADCQNSLMQMYPQNQKKYADRWFEYTERAYELDSDNALLAFRLGVSYCERGDCDKAQPILKPLGPLPYLSQQDNDLLLRCKQKCDAD